MSSETEECSVAPAVDPAIAASAAELIIDESCAAAAAAAVTASFNAAAQGNHTQKDTETSQNADTAVDVSEKVNETKVTPVNGTVDNNVEGNSETCVTDEVKQRRSVSGSPLPASTSGSLVPATGYHFFKIIVFFTIW